MNIDDLHNELHELNDRFQQGTTVIMAEDCGLDARCGTLLVCDDYVASRNAKRIDYYGGFEYIEEDNRIKIGDWTYYFAENSRVKDCLDHFADSER